MRTPEESNERVTAKKKIKMMSSKVERERQEKEEDINRQLPKT